MADLSWLRSLGQRSRTPSNAPQSDDGYLSDSRYQHREGKYDSSPTTHRHQTSPHRNRIRALPAMHRVSSMLSLNLGGTTSGGAGSEGSSSNAQHGRDGNRPSHLTLSATGSRAATTPTTPKSFEEQAAELDRQLQEAREQGEERRRRRFEHGADAWHNATTLQAVEALQAAMMERRGAAAAREPLPARYASCVLQLVEGFGELRAQARRLEAELAEARRLREREAGEFRALSAGWAERERDYEREVRRLEVLLARTSRDGAETVALARAGSVVDRRGDNRIQERLKRLSSAQDDDTTTMVEQKVNRGASQEVGLTRETSAHRTIASIPRNIEPDKDILLSEQLRERQHIERLTQAAIQRDQAAARKSSRRGFLRGRRLRKTPKKSSPLPKGLQELIDRNPETPQLSPSKRVTSSSSSAASGSSTSTDSPLFSAQRFVPGSHAARDRQSGALSQIQPRRGRVPNRQGKHPSEQYFDSRSGNVSAQGDEKRGHTASEASGHDGSPGLGYVNNGSSNSETTAQYWAAETPSQLPLIQQVQPQLPPNQRRARGFSFVAGDDAKLAITPPVPALAVISTPDASAPRLGSSSHHAIPSARTDSAPPDRELQPGASAAERQEAGPTSHVVGSVGSQISEALNDALAPSVSTGSVIYAGDRINALRSFDSTSSRNTVIRDNSGRRSQRSSGAWEATATPMRRPNRAPTTASSSGTVSDATTGPASLHGLSNQGSGDSSGAAVGGRPAVSRNVPSPATTRRDSSISSRGVKSPSPAPRPSVSHATPPPASGSTALPGSGHGHRSRVATTPSPTPSSGTDIAAARLAATRAVARRSQREGGSATRTGQSGNGSGGGGVTTS